MSKRVLVPYRNEKKLKNYVEALRAAELEPVSVRASGRAELGGTDGLLLIGGTDVNPKLYGADRAAETQDPDDERDAYELEILERAMQADLPVLAICRGMQMLNVYAGGTLRQHLGSVRHDPPKEPPFAHEVEIEPGTLLSAIAGKPRWGVNSRHHQAVGRTGSELRVSAQDTEDGTIEAVEHPGRSFVMGVQWHPEDLVFEAPEQLELFRAFGRAMASAKRTPRPGKAAPQTI